MKLKPVHDSSHLYFMTVTISGWIPLFEKEAYRNIIFSSLDWHSRNERWLLYAFVIMPNHLHTIIRPLPSQTISDNLQSFGSFTSHAILKQLKSDDKAELLGYFKSCQTDPTKNHKIWQDSHAKNIFSSDFLRQKIEYIHNNPVAKHWHLASARSAYLWSSACFYDLGEEPTIPVSDVRELF